MSLAKRNVYYVESRACFYRLITYPIIFCIFLRKWITAGGIRSTGLSGCLGIAAKVNDLMEKVLRVEPTRGRSFSVARPEVQILNNGVVKVDGSHYRITHPLSYLGLETHLTKL